MILLPTFSPNETKAQWTVLTPEIATILRELHQAFLQIQPVIPSLQAMQCSINASFYESGEWVNNLTPTGHQHVFDLPEQPLQPTYVYDQTAIITSDHVLLQANDSSQFITTCPVAPELLG